MSFEIIQCPQIINLQRVNGVAYVNGGSSVGFGSGTVNHIAAYTGNVSAPFLKDSGINVITDNVQGSYLDLNAAVPLKNFVYYDKVHNTTGIINATASSNLIEFGNGVAGVKLTINGDDGTDGQVLTSVSGKVTWATPSGGSGSIPSVSLYQPGVVTVVPAGLPGDPLQFAVTNSGGLESSWNDPATGITFTAPQAGTYEFNVTVNITALSDPAGALTMYLNGSTDIGHIYPLPGSTCSLSQIWTLAQNDTMQFLFGNNGSTNIAVQNVNTTIKYLGPLPP